MGVKFWFCLGGLIFNDSLGVQGHVPEKFLEFGALNLHFQHSENTFGEILMYGKHYNQSGISAVVLYFI